MHVFGLHKVEYPEEEECESFRQTWRDSNPQPWEHEPAYSPISTAVPKTEAEVHTAESRPNFLLAVCKRCIGIIAHLATPSHK